MLIFHIGLKEPPRSCTFSGQAAVKGSKRRADNWIHWFKEIQFYQVCKKKPAYIKNSCCKKKGCINKTVFGMVT